MRYFGFDRSGFAFKSVGSAVGVTLSANFVTDEYALNGATTTFADLFTFNRAGKAWLVKDTGLQEYAADVPRFDDGLLIEQSATNRITNINPSAVVGSNTLVSAVADSTFNNRAYSLTAKGDGRINITYAFSEVYTNDSASIYVKKTANSMPLSVSGFHTNASAASFVFDSKNGTFIVEPPAFIGNSAKVISLNDDWWHVSMLRTGSGTYRYLSFGNSVDDGDLLAGTSLVVAIPQQIIGLCLPHSPIITTGTPVTRPADFLLNKITGTAVTGDWDSTLTLSIVAGQLVHSGYGRIRSLEID